MVGTMGLRDPISRAISMVTGLRLGFSRLDLEAVFTAGRQGLC